MSDGSQRLWGVIEPFVAAEGVELDDLLIAGKDPGVVVRVILDAPGGIGVDRLAELSRSISRLLDDVEPAGGSYTLEVTSPGLERKLRRPAQYGKSVGREVKVKTTAEVDGAHNHRGLLIESDETGFVIEVEGSRRRIAYGDVASAQTVFVWEKAAKPGQRR